MKSRKSQTALFLLLALVFSACTSRSPKPVFSSALASQTVEVYMTDPNLVIVTEQSQSTISPILKTAIPTKMATQPHQDLGYYDGIVVITQYYTFLGHGDYVEAYQLLSSFARRHSPDLDEYVQSGKQWFKKVQIIAVRPLYVDVERQGGRYSPSDTIDEKRFFVQIIAWGEGRMSGSVMSGNIQTLFITLIQENGEWKIKSFATAP
ncbi:MAG: hypothetical protein HRF40_13045 [Nitrososphaera sp.]|jgi:hypothetical protein